MSGDVGEIELRSEKVRNIIGQIPPRIIRIGILLIFFFIIGILSVSYFFKYEYIIKTIATIEQYNDSTYIEIFIPANEFDKIKINQKIILNFNNIPNLYDEKFNIKLQTIPNILHINKNGGYYLLKQIYAGNMYTESGKSISISQKINTNAEIITEKISFSDRMIKPFNSILKKK